MNQRWSQRAEGTVPLMLVMVVPLCFSGICVGQLLSVTPESRNVSAGTLVELTCATPETGFTSFSLTTTPHIDDSDTVVTHPNGSTQLTLSFIAPIQHSTVNIACIIISRGTVSRIAVLMIQGLLAGVGNLISSEVDHCTLHFTWTAPYTLQGVPINYYTINITRHSDGAVLRSDTTHTTEYLYTVSSLGETLVVVVAAVNGAGTGNESMMTGKLNKNFPFELKIIKRIRNGARWTFSSIIKTGIICMQDTVILVFQDENSDMVYKASANLTKLPNGDLSVVAIFPNLTENILYQPLANVYNYDDIMLLQSNHVDTTQVNANTFDISRVNYTIYTGVIKITVEYVHECEFPCQFYVELQCKSQTLKKFFDGSSGSINNVPSNKHCILLVTDGDAMNSINETTPFKKTIQTDNNDVDYNIMGSPTPSPSPPKETSTTNDQLTIIVTVTTAVSVLLIVVIGVVIVIIVFFFKKSDSKDKNISPTQNNNSIGGITVLYGCICQMCISTNNLVQETQSTVQETQSTVQETQSTVQETQSTVQETQPTVQETSETLNCKTYNEPERFTVNQPTEVIYLERNKLSVPQVIFCASDLQDVTYSTVKHA